MLIKENKPAAFLMDLERTIAQQTRHKWNIPELSLPVIHLQHEAAELLNRQLWH